MSVGTVFELTKNSSSVFPCNAQVRFSCHAFLSVFLLVTCLITDRHGLDLIVGSAHRTIKFPSILRLPLSRLLSIVS